jgi:peptidoglycan/LPS O-acetylase OafA/YrhL
MIKSITGWRVFFILLIILHHVGLDQLDMMSLGVCFFFMSSGFLLSLKYPFAELDGKSYRSFVWRRMLRIYPLHWLTPALWLVASALLGTLVIEPLTLTLNASLLHCWSLTYPVYYSYVKVSWFLGALLFCYLCYPMLAHWFLPLRLRHKLAILALLSIVAILILAGTDDYSRTALYVFPPMRLIDFLIGMTLPHLCQVVKRLPVIGKSDNGIDAELVAVAVLSLAVMVHGAYPGVRPWSDTVIWWIPMALLIMVCYLYDKREGYVGKLMASRPLQWIGGVCFELFMMQNLAALVYNYLLAPVLGSVGLPQLGIDPYSLLPWMIIPLGIVIAWVVNRCFTRPINRLMAKN